MARQEDKYPNTKEIIFLLGLGTLLLGSILMPGLAVAGGAIIRAKRNYDFKQSQKEWKKFNLKLLKRNLKRLQEQKVIEIIGENGQEVIKLTQKGKTKFLKFRMEELSSKGKLWDKKWRLVLYDISHLKKAQQENFRKSLRQMNFLLLQKSAYLTPYPFNDEIEYLREYFNLGQEVLILEVSKIENDSFYKDYFGLS